MSDTTNRILTLNAGSSSVKFALFVADSGLTRIRSGAIDRVESDDAALDLLRAVQEKVGNQEITAVGHRLVHGGPRHFGPAMVSEELLAELRQLATLDPDHLPREIALIEAVKKMQPEWTQIVCFDTAFHERLPLVAQWLAIPRRYYAQGVRRYGFHGLSYTFLMQELTRRAGAKAAQGRVVLAHLGNGSSLAAVQGGKSVDTTMGFTPASGVPMSTRSGDLDPGLIDYLARREQMTPAKFQKMVNHESGLLGISETSADMRDLAALQASDSRAAEAIELYCYQVRKAIGALAAAMNGLDALVFSGGIGEHAAEIRYRICKGLQFLGVSLDDEQNNRSSQKISADDGNVAVWVIPTNEEQVIAQAVIEHLEKRAK